MRRPLLALAAALALSPLVLHAQLPRDATPEQVAQAALDARAGRDWRALVALSDPEAVDSMRARYLHNLEVFGERGHVFEGGYPGAPPCVQEWFKAHRADQFPAGDEHVKVILEVPDLEAARALPAPVVLERHLRNYDHARLDSLAVRHRGRGSGIPAGIRGDYFRAQRQAVVGAIVEGDSLAHVAFRRADDRPVFSPSGLEMITLRRTPAGWRVWRADYLHGNTQSIGIDGSNRMQGSSAGS